MDSNQIKQQLDWLDEERRNDKNLISDLNKRISNLEVTVVKALKENKDLNSEITRLSVIITRFEDYKKDIENIKKEIEKEVNFSQDQSLIREQDFLKRHDIEHEGLEKKLTEYQKKLQNLKEIEDQVVERKEENTRLQKSINDIKAALSDTSQLKEEYMRSKRSMEDNFSQNERRINDLIGDMISLRKYTDEARATLDLVSDSQKKFEGRVNDLISSEVERKDSMVAFIENVKAQQNEMEKTWKEAFKELSSLEKLATDIPQKIQSLEFLQRSIGQAKEDFEQMQERLDRRINEISEIQRLNDDRFRQEWNTFKADDQKRWTNYILNQEEQQRELRRSVEKVVEQTSNLDDVFQGLQDIVKFNSEQQRKLTHSALSLLKEWISENERFSSSIT
ncbi:MAG: hypothetical protein JXA19_06420 [Anaerolineales bacterium]|nr:hypothetical protein [Anaerolineales bacterium]